MALVRYRGEWDQDGSEGLNLEQKAGRQEGAVGRTKLWLGFGVKVVGTKMEGWDSASHSCVGTVVSAQN